MLIHVGHGEKMSDSPRGGGSQRVSVPEGINLLHNEGKLLYLLSRYASAAPEGALAVGAASVERWLRRVPLLVLHRWLAD